MHNIQPSKIAAARSTGINNPDNWADWFYEATFGIRKGESTATPAPVCTDGPEDIGTVDEILAEMEGK